MTNLYKTLQAQGIAPAVTLAPHTFMVALLLGKLKQVELLKLYDGYPSTQSVIRRSQHITIGTPYANQSMLITQYRVLDDYDCTDSTRYDIGFVLPNLHSRQEYTPYRCSVEHSNTTSFYLTTGSYTSPVLYSEPTPSDYTNQYKITRILPKTIVRTNVGWRKLEDLKHIHDLHLWLLSPNDSYFKTGQGGMWYKVVDIDALIYHPLVGWYDPNVVRQVNKRYGTTTFMPIAIAEKVIANDTNFIEVELVGGLDVAKEVDAMIRQDTKDFISSITPVTVAQRAERAKRLVEYIAEHTAPTKESEAYTIIGVGYPETDQFRTGFNWLSSLCPRLRVSAELLPICASCGKPLFVQERALKVPFTRYHTYMPLDEPVVKAFCSSECLCNHTTTCIERRKPSRYSYGTSPNRYLSTQGTTHKPLGKPTKVGVEFESYLDTQGALTMMSSMEFAPQALEIATVKDLVEKLDVQEHRPTLTAKSVRKAMCIPTRDGSLDDTYGYEFIFQAAGIEQQKDNVSTFGRLVMPHIRPLRDRDRNYGLHIHVSKPDVLNTVAGMYRLANVVFHLQDFLYTVSGRPATGYAHTPRAFNVRDILRTRNNRIDYLKRELGEYWDQVTKQFKLDNASIRVISELYDRSYSLESHRHADYESFLSEFLKITQKFRIRKGQLSPRCVMSSMETGTVDLSLISGKYRAVNIEGCRGNTIEFRLFSAVTNTNHTKLAIEVSYAIVMFSAFYINCTKANNKYAVMAGFKDYVNSNRKMYPDLCQFMQDNPELLVSAPATSI